MANRNNPDPQQSLRRVADAIASCSGVLSGLSNRETVEALRALCGMHNLVVQYPGQIAQRSAAAASQTQQRAVRGRPAQRRQPQRPRSAEEDALRTALARNRLDVLAEAARLQVARLPDDHEMVIARRQLEERIHSFRTGGESSQAS